MITARRILYFAFVLLLVESCAPKSFVSSTNSIHLALGNPTQANDSSPDNYLIVKPQYTLSYNRTKGHANWVAWELSRNWLGSSDRQNDFRPDDNLPQSWVKIVPSDYSNTGFDRGHLCPSADRTNSPTTNSSTFLMTNIIPQAPELNRESWAYLEEFCRDLALQKYKLYITAGTYGTGGEGSKGSARKINDKVNVPARIYKIIVVLPENGSISDLSADTPVIAVDFPNKSNALQNAGWFRFVTTVAEIEEKTGTRFFSSTTSSVRNSLINKRFDYRNSSIDIDTKCSVYKGNTLFVGRSGGCYYFNAKGNKTYVERNLCDCK